MKVLLLVLMGFQFTIQLYSQNFWQQTNGPYNGATVNDFLHYNDSVIFLATYEGIVKSSDNGETWERIYTSKIKCLATDKTGILYAAENYLSNNFYLLKSTNEGITWNRMNINIWPDIRQIMIPYKDTIFIATWNYGVCRSTDDGNTWLQINNGIEYTKINRIVLLSNGQLLVGTDGGGVYKSSNFGDTWVQSSSGIPSYTSGYKFANSFCEIAPGEILVGAQDGIYYSTNFGDSWFWRNSGYNHGRANRIIKDYAGNVYAGTSISGGVYKSTNKGGYWTHLGLGNSIHTLGWDSDSNLYAGTLSWGLYRYTFQDTSWTQIFNKGYTPIEVTKLSLSNSGTIISGTYWWGIHRSTDGGETWNRTSYNGDFLNLKSINDSIIITGYGSEYVSNDTGNTWNITGNFTLVSLHFDPGKQVIYVGSVPNIYKSTDLGYSWEYITTFSGIANVRAIHIIRTNQNILIDVVYPNWPNASSQFLISSDHGITWEVKLNNEFITQIEEDNFGNIYALGNSLNVSDDEGRTWTQKNIGGRELLTMDNNGRLFTASPGLYYSEDYAMTWFPLPTTGLTGSGGINDIKIDGNNKIYLATLNGIYFGDGNNIVSVNHEINQVRELSLSQNYPNPFNPSTRINWHSPVSSHQTLKVYDVLGREVATLVNEYRDAGSYEVVFDGSQLASGIYYYQLKVGEFVETKKMLMLK